MPTKVKYRSPTLELHITPENYETARQSESGGCLIADAIKRQYPHLSGIRVDMATIRVSDRKKGVRFMYLTPPEAQQVLLFFDQGWRQPLEEVRVARAVKVTPITASKPRTAERQRKLEELQAKKDAGEQLTTQEKASLKRLKSTTKRPRPASTGKVQVSQQGVVHGGAPSTQGTKTDNPNLLRGRDRHFGAKQAKPGEVFEQAVQEALEQKALQSVDGEKESS